MKNNDLKPSFNRQWLLDLLKRHQNYHALNTSENEQIINHIREESDMNIHVDPILHNKVLAVAPMVEQSDLPFRLQCRKYGANLAFTPMIHARYFVMKQSYREKMFDLQSNNLNLMNNFDRPLIAQICGSNKEILLQAAKMLEKHVDAIDLNCGCPTKTAKRGRYGAFLLQSDEFLVGIVRYLTENLTCPLSVKVRLIPGDGETIDLEKSIALYEKLVDAGISLLTVHGRTRFQKGESTGKADWNAIQKVVEKLGTRIPIIANGNIKNLDDVRDCLAQTGVDGVMSSESILEYPPLFTETQTKVVGYARIGPGRLQIAREYLDLCQLFPPDKGGGGSGLQCIRMHLDIFLHEDWKQHPKLRECLLRATDMERLYKIIGELEEDHRERGHKVEEEQSSWYMRHRSYKNLDGK